MKTRTGNAAAGAGRDDLYRMLMATMDRLGIPVRCEPLQSAEHLAKSGVCRYKGELLVVLDRAGDLEERIGVLVEALRRVDTDDIYLPPALRELVHAEPDPGEGRR